MKYLIILSLLILSSPLFSQAVPELMYFRFENNAGTTTPNYASAPVGTNPAPVTGHTLGSGGQFDSCMVGIGGTYATNNLNTSWATSLPSTGWTISMWVTNLTDLNPTYLWGDVNSSSFRCFYGGAAGANNVLLRCALFPDVLVTGVMPGPTVVHFVYNGSSIIAYKNGVQATTVSASGITISGAGPFYVGAYNGVGSSMSGSMDEFRMYNRALTASEITATWNVELPAASPPAPPTLVAPPNNATGVSLTPLLDWNNVTGANTYGVQVSTNSGFTTTVVNQTGLTSSQYMVPASILMNNTQYYWRANATNSAGTSAWSTVWNFTTVVAAPSAPTLVAPPNNSTGQPLTPLLDWNDVSGAASYRAVVSTDSTFPSTVLDTSVTVSQVTVPSGRLANNVRYFWRVNATNSGGTGPWSTVWNFTTALTAINTYGNEIPKEFKLYNNFPNPFNPVTKIRFDLPASTLSFGEGQGVRLVIYDMLGREIAVLVNQGLLPGKYEVTWNADNYPSGTYIYGITVSDFTASFKMVLIK